jgi:hypothetical protein
MTRLSFGQQRLSAASLGVACLGTYAWFTAQTGFAQIFSVCFLDDMPTYQIEVRAINLEVTLQV